MGVAHKDGLRERLGIGETRGRRQGETMGRLGRGISNSKLAAVGVAQKDRDRGREDRERRDQEERDI